MAKSGVEVKGLRELVKNLEAMGVEVADLKVAFGRISDKASQLAASYAPSRTGKLKSSIKGSKTKNRASVKAGGARVPYAGAVHWGWKKRGITPQPFMVRADEKIRPDVIPMIEDEISTILKDKGFQ